MLVTERLSGFLVGGGFAVTPYLKCIAPSDIANPPHRRDYFAKKTGTGFKSKGIFMPGSVSRLLQMTVSSRENEKRCGQAAGDGKRGRGNRRWEATEFGNVATHTV